MDVNPIELQKHLKGADYPASRDDLVALARDNGAPRRHRQRPRGRGQRLLRRPRRRAARAVLRRPAGGDAVLAGLVAAVTSGAPSTAVTLARGEDLLEGARAAGSLLLPRETRTVPLLAAAVPVHLALSVGWALVLDQVLPRGREVPAGALAGLAIAALDLGVIGRRLPPHPRAAAGPPVGRPRRLRAHRGRRAGAPAHS